MIKILPAILLAAFSAAFLAVPALAATSASFSPASVNARAGQTFNLAIAVNPQGAKNYTVKAELNYPADLLEVKSFAFAPSWLALAQPGYDLTDNGKGVLIKTAGYPGGVSSAITFGTAVFRAKKSGNGVITLSNNSLALDANNQNVIAGSLPRAAITILAAAAPVTPTTAPTPSTGPTKDGPTVPEETAVAPEATTAGQPETQPSLLASIGSVITLGTGSAVVGILVGAIILILIGYALYAVIKKRIRRPDDSSSTDSIQPKEPPPVS